MKTGTAIDGAVAAAILTAVVYQIGNLVKYVLNSQWRTAGTHIVVVAIGFAVICLFAASTSFQGTRLPVLDVPISSLSILDCFIVSLALYGPAGALFDFLQSVDQTGSSSKPSMF